jgi:dTDP-glucose 4,6-dehydratase
MRTIMVTGGSGFIGSNFVRYMLGKYPDYRIVNFDKLTYAGNPENLADLDDDFRYEFIKGDIGDLSAVLDAFKRHEVSALINFAAESHVDRSIESAAEFMQTNVLGTQILLEATKRYPLARIIHISTDEVYGSIEKGSFVETDRLEPSSPYSSSKAASDLVCHAYKTTYDLPIIITRSSNNFGPYQYPEKLIPLLTTNALEDKSLPIYGDGLNVRDWIYVEDNCAGIDAVFHSGNVGEIYNIGGGNEVPNIEIARAVIKELDKDESLITYVADRLGHDRRYSINCAKLKELGWAPEYSFKDALSKTIDWYKNNEAWWQKLKGGVAL